MKNDVDFDPDKMIVGFEVYRNGTMRVLRRSAPTTPTRGERMNITMLTTKARDKMMFTVSTTATQFHSMITLTYPELWPDDGERVKYELKLFKQRFLREFGGEIFWFLEFQKRGAPHFHLLTTVKDPTRPQRVSLAYMWADIVVPRPGREADREAHLAAFEQYKKVWSVHAYTRAWEPIKSDQGAMKYIAKYAFKTYQKEVPQAYENVGQFWGCSKGVRETCVPILEADGDAKTIRAILETEGHRVADFAWLPKNIYSVSSLEMVDTA